MACFFTLLTLRVERRLAGLVLGHLVRRVLLALLAEGLLRLGDVHHLDRLGTVATAR